MDIEKVVFFPCVVKSQIPAGGRGKTGGIQTVTTQKELESTSDQLLDFSISGYKPRNLLYEELINISHEYYFALTINRSSGYVELMAHAGGGVSVESQDKNKFFRQAIDEKTLDYTINECAQYLKLDTIETFNVIVKKAYNCFIDTDCILLEINPLVLTTQSELIAVDCKMELDDNAAFRHPEWDFEDKPKNTNFVTLNEKGNVATIANGAGLAMATVDAVAAAGMKPANFLDIGGGANEASVTTAFESILEYPHIKAIIVNIFAGITRCDEVAKAIIAAKKSFPDLPPLFIRLDGTNYNEAKTILDQAHINLLPSLEDCLKAAQEVSL